MNVSLRRPSDEEYQKMTIKLVTHAINTHNLRNIIVNCDEGKPDNMFIKEKNAGKQGVKEDGKESELKSKESKGSKMWDKKDNTTKKSDEIVSPIVKAKTQFKCRVRKEARKGVWEET